ncbi:hypothetical protein BKA67DRAFT_648846 [Truncatella angustata]|uniref:Uncharacterized protein n=1 Tax=Truncatella angustata TaxID=152316 RepID=A0A9P8UFD1_9PEZI|nr:uncharacterized protein BKA67DRAFT_648846 [Truncatella angustata]KAH6648874.1 hypothetical protein BKA67DRAFT_648846 [Truncatella angustata]
MKNKMKTLRVLNTISLDQNAVSIRRHNISSPCFCRAQRRPVPSSPSLLVNRPRKLPMFYKPDIDDHRLLHDPIHTQDGQRKDTAINAEEYGHFVWNLVTWHLREETNSNAEQVPYGVYEFERASLEKTVDVIISKFAAVHIADEVLANGILDIRKTMLVARCGYYQYAVVKDTAEMKTPRNSEAILNGLERTLRKLQLMKQLRRRRT